MNDTANGVDEAISRLAQYERVVREEVGFRSLISMERLIDGQRGKRNIREALHRLVYFGASNKNEARARAENLLLMIDEFNAAIIELHDLVIKERRQKERADLASATAAPTRRSAKKKRK